MLLNGGAVSIALWLKNFIDDEGRIVYWSGTRSLPIPGEFLTHSRLISISSTTSTVRGPSCLGCWEWLERLVTGTSGCSGDSHEPKQTRD
jgi:hypothetical protein